MNVLSRLHHTHVILDACCVINFCESGHLEEILAPIKEKLVIATYVLESEVIRHKPLLQPLIDSRRLFITDTNGPLELNDYLNFAYLELEDGEAISGAIAKHRNWAVATDEVKAIEFFKLNTPGLQIITTPDFIKYWAETNKIAENLLQEVIQAIHFRGRYGPSQKHPLFKWWYSKIPGLTKSRSGEPI